jgi:spore coat protein H
MSNRSRAAEAACFPVVAALAWSLAAQPACGIARGDVRKAPAADVFGAGKVWKVHLAFSAKEYEAMQPPTRPTFFGWAQPKPAEKSDREVHRNAFGFDLPLAVGSVTIDGQAFDNVCVRYKGNGTYGDASRSLKRSFKIDLGRGGAAARFHGMKTVNLHCGVTDPSKCREALGYSLYRSAGVPAPRTAFAEVALTVPGKYDSQLLGLYTAVEQVDKEFLRRHFGDGDGLLMKPERVREFEYQGDDWARYKAHYSPKRDASPEEAKRVVAFCKLVSRGGDEEFREQVGSYLDVDSFLRFMAATALVVNPDSFFSLGHNYYLYLHPKTKRLHLFPWDLDRAFANFGVFGTAEQQMDLSLDRPYGGANRLADRLMSIPGVRERYRKVLKELAAGCFSKAELLREVNSVEAAVKGLVAADAKAAADRKESGAPAGGYMFGRPPELRTFAEKRAASVAAQLAGKSRGHVPGGAGFGAPPPPAPARPGELLSAQAQDQLRLDPGQRGKLAELQREVEARLRKILDDGQNEQLGKMREARRP